MTRIILLTTSLLLAVAAFSQNIKGSWNGVLNVGNIKLSIILNISEKESVYSATMDSPNQGAKGIPVSAINFENAKLAFSIANIGVEYVVKSFFLRSTHKRAIPALRFAYPNHAKFPIIYRLFHLQSQ